MFEFLIVCLIVGIVFVGAGYVGFLIGLSKGTKAERRWWIVHTYDARRMN